MTWGALYMYYHCPKCGMKFEYALDVMTEFGDEFGFCPECHVMGVYVIICCTFDIVQNVKCVLCKKH